jgi:hypothetical protein
MLERLFQVEQPFSFYKLKNLGALMYESYLILQIV